MNAIEIRNLTKKYGEKTAVDNLNLDVSQGELYALLGVNGAGKTTTIKMLSGIVKPTGGDATVMGHSILQDMSAVKRVINVSPQESAVAPNLTVYENLELMSGIYGTKPADAKKAAQETIAEFGMEEISKQRAKTLSGGWQRRLSIAMALISKPQVLFLDEPTLGLDVLARRELWREIEKLKGTMTVILTTHYLEEAEALADHIAIMVSGKLAAAGTAAELKAKAGKTSFEDAFVEIVTGGEKQ